MGGSGIAEAVNKPAVIERESASASLQLKLTARQPNTIT